jgi:hypothetical protein
MLGSTNAINSRNPSVTPQFQSLSGMGLSGGGKGCASWSQSSANKHYTKSDEPSEKTGGAILGLQDGTLAGDRSKPIQHQTHTITNQRQIIQENLVHSVMRLQHVLMLLH